MQTKTSWNSPMTINSVAAVWLVGLTLLNIGVGGSLRNTLLFAVPVGLASFRDLRAGFVFAGIAALAAWLGGAIPSPQHADPLWQQGLWAFLKLSVVALSAHYGARPHRTG